MYVYVNKNCVLLACVLFCCYIWSRQAAAAGPIFVFIYLAFAIKLYSFPRRMGGVLEDEPQLRRAAPSYSLAPMALAP